MTMLEAPRAIHRGEDDIPFVSLGDGTHLQLLQVDIEQGLLLAVEHTHLLSLHLGRGVGDRGGSGAGGDGFGGHGGHP